MSLMNVVRIAKVDTLKASKLLGAWREQGLLVALPGRGKRGGVRVIYYWLRKNGQIYMLLIYPKSKKDTLTDRETAILFELVKEL